MADQIRRVIEADPRPYLNALRQSSDATRRFGAAQNSEFRRVAASFKGILGTLGVGFSVAGIIGASDRVTLGLRKIQVGSGAAGRELKRLEGVFDDVFSRVPQDAEEVGSAIAALNSILGAEGDVLEDLSLKVLNASRLMGEDGANNATLFARALNQFSEPAEKGADILDALFNVSQRTGIGFGELINATNEYGSVLKNAGFSIEESAELFGRLSSAGISVSRVSPGLNAAFRNWAKEGKNVREELGRVVRQMRDAKTETKALAIASDAFGAEGAQRLTTAVRTGRLEVEGLNKTIGESPGSIDKANKATITWGEALSTLANKLSAAGSAVVNFLASPRRLIDFLESISKSRLEQDVESLSRALVISGEEIRRMPFEDMIKRIEASGNQITTFGVITTTRMKQLAESIRDARQEASLLAELDLVASGAGGRTTSPTTTTDRNRGAGTDLFLSGEKEAKKDLERREKGLKELELEFLNAEAVRVFEQGRIPSRDLSLDEQERLLTPGFDAEFEGLLEDIDKAIASSGTLEKAWEDIGDRIGNASLTLIEGLVRGTLDWKDALQLVLREVVSIVNALAQAQGGSSGGGGIASTIFGAIGGLVGGFGGGGGGGIGFNQSAAEFAQFGSFSSVGVDFAEGGVVMRPTFARMIGEAGPEAIIPLDRMADVMRDVRPNNAIGDRIQPNSERPIIIEVSHNGTIVEPSQFKPTPDEQWDVLVDGVKHVARVRDAIGSEVSRRTGR